MRSRSLCLIKLVILMLTLVLFLPGFQVKKLETASINGVIEGVDKDFKFITVNGTRFHITSDTTIVDGKGDPLKIKELRLKLPVTAEVVRNPNGFFIKNITVKSVKGKP
jgi:hypothetical protein